MAAVGLLVVLRVGFGVENPTIAARATRDPKRHTPVGELLPRWVADCDGSANGKRPSAGCLAPN